MADPAPAPTPVPRGPTWLTVLAVAVAAVATVVAADAALHRVAPPKPLREVEDAVADWRDADPTILVLGSSHARTFITVGRELSERTGGRERMLPVPLEMGKMTSYEWVLNHRLAPLIDERDASGAKVRPSLSRVLLVTEWWDSADPENILTKSNVPARAWTLADFLDDAVQNGLTPYNRNYVGYRWVRMTRASAMVQDRGHEGILNGLKVLARGPDPAGEKAAFDKRVEGWRFAVERGATIEQADAQMAALGRMLDFFQEHGLEVTILLYPRMPVTLTPKSKATTLQAFSDRMVALAGERRLRLVDATLQHPLTDADFEADFDHVTPEGNRTFAKWALDGSLAFLLQPRAHAAPAPAGGGTP